MPSKYRISDHEAPHFITFATIQWVDALSRPDYKDVIMASLDYCMKNKGLILNAYVIMSNHLHMIASAKPGCNLSAILRDFKKHTSKELLRSIKGNSRESRRSWMLRLFKSAGINNSNNQQYQFWQQDNHPVELSTNRMMDQRLDYIHDNPVKAGLVRAPEDYIYSSAIDYSGGKGLIEIELIS